MDAYMIPSSDTANLWWLECQVKVDTKKSMRTAPCTGLYVLYRYYVGQRNIMAILGVADQTTGCWGTPCRASFCPVSVLSGIGACTNLGTWPDCPPFAAWISCTKHCIFSLKQHPFWGGSDFHCQYLRSLKMLKKLYHLAGDLVHEWPETFRFIWKNHLASDKCHPLKGFSSLQTLNNTNQCASHFWDRRIFKRLLPRQNQSKNHLILIGTMLIGAGVRSFNGLFLFVQKNCKILIDDQPSSLRMTPHELNDFLISQDTTGITWISP